MGSSDISAYKVVSFWAQAKGELFNSKTSFISSNDRLFFALKNFSSKNLQIPLMNCYSYLFVIVEETWIYIPDMYL